MTERETAEAGVQAIAKALGKEIPAQLVPAIADIFISTVAAVTGVALKRAERAGQAAADAIVTDADAAARLAR